METLQIIDSSSLFFTIVVPILIGLILLIIEYRTKWFASRFASDNSKQKTVSLLNEKVVPIDKLENPVGDWIQIAEQVRELLDKDTKPEHSGIISLLGIHPNKSKSSAKLTFAFWGNPHTDDPYHSH